MENEARRRGLEALAAGLRIKRPGTVVRIIDEKPQATRRTTNMPTLRLPPQHKQTSKAGALARLRQIPLTGSVEERLEYAHEHVLPQLDPTLALVYLLALTHKNYDDERGEVLISYGELYGLVGDDDGDNSDAYVDLLIAALLDLDETRAVSVKPVVDEGGDMMMADDGGWVERFRFYQPS